MKKDIINRNVNYTCKIILNPVYQKQKQSPMMAKKKSYMVFVSKESNQIKMTDTAKKADEIRKLHQTLQLCQGDTRSMLQICDKLLALTPGDPTLLRYKITVLIDANQFENALGILRSLPKTAAWPFGIAYCLYRQEKFEEALTQLGSATGYEERNLRAQCFYRSENYPAAAKEYAELLKMATGTQSPEELDEIAVNYTASLLEAQNAAEAQQYAKEYGNPRRNLDFLINHALAGAHRGEYKESARMVSSAVDIAALRAEDVEGTLSSEEASICALLGYDYAQLGDDASAQGYLGTAIRRKTNATTTMAVCQNNWVAVQGVHDVFDSLHKMKQVLSRQVEAKLTSQQRVITKYNHAMLLLHMKKPQQALSIAQTLARDNPQSELAAVALASVLNQTGQKAKAIETLEGFLKDSGKAPSRRVVLTLAELTLEHTKDMDAVLSVLGRLGPDQLYQSNIISAIVHNALSRQRKDVAVRVLNAAVDHWRKKGKGAASNTTLVELLQRLSRVQMENGMYAEAVDTYKILLEHVQDDATLAGYVMALSNVNVDEAISMAARLPTYYNAAKLDVDRATVESEEFPRAQLVKPEKRQAEQRSGSAPKKRRRRPRPKPASAAAGVPPDPERWMAIRDRPSLKKLGKKALAKLAQERREAGQRAREEHKRRMEGGAPSATSDAPVS